MMGASCSDDNLCNGEETCNGTGTCQPGTALDCNDGKACTDDSCIPASGCKFTNDNTNTCDDGKACTTGEFYVTDDNCTHGPGSLSEGYLDGHEIECDFHQGCFDIRTGEVTVPPCIVPIKTYKVVVEGGRVTIEV
jgi:nitrite reductase/ring-hydroxylating ferredoxin subunit